MTIAEVEAVVEEVFQAAVLTTRGVKRDGDRLTIPLAHGSVFRATFNDERGVLVVSFGPHGGPEGGSLDNVPCTSSADLRKRVEAQVTTWILANIA